MAQSFRGAFSLIKSFSESERQVTGAVEVQVVLIIVVVVATAAAAGVGLAAEQQ